MPTLAPADQARVQRIRQLRASPKWDTIDDGAKAEIESYLSGLVSQPATPAPVVQAIGVPGTPNEFIGNNAAPATPPAETMGGDILAGLNRGGPLVSQQVSGAMATAGQYIPGAIGRRLTQYGNQGVDMAQGAMDRFPAPQTIPGQIAEAAPGLLSAVGVGLATAGAGLPAVAGTMAGAGAVGAQTAGGTYVETRNRLGAQGAPQELVDQAAADQALPSGIFGAVTGTLPIGRILGRTMPGASIPLGAAMERIAANPIGRRLVEAAVGGSQNAAQELFNHALRAVAEDDPATADEILRGVGHAALVGGLMTAGTAEVVGALGGRPETAPPDATPETVATTRAGTPEVPPPPAETGTPAGVSGQTAPRDGIVLTSAEALGAARAIRERQTGRRDLSPPATGVVAPTDSAPAAVAPTGTIDDVRAFAAAKRQRDAIRQAAADLDAKIASALGLAPGTDVGAVLDRATVKAEPSKGGAAARVPVQSEGGSAEALLNELRAMREGQTKTAADGSVIPRDEQTSLPSPSREASDVSSVGLGRTQDNPPSSQRAPDQQYPIGIQSSDTIRSTNSDANAETTGTPATKPANTSLTPDTSLDSMTPAQLRREAKKRKLDSTGTGKQLLERLRTQETPAEGVAATTTPESAPIASTTERQGSPAESVPVSDSSSNPTPATGAKEPWEMTRAEFLAMSPGELSQTPDTPAWERVLKKPKGTSPYTSHRISVAIASEEGRAVPPEVLADYPELAKAAKDSTPQPAAPGKRAVSGSDKGGDTPTLADRAVSKLDQIAADAKERIKKRPGVQRGGPKGSRAGQGQPLIGDTVDTAVYAAAKALASTIKGGQALTRVVESAIKELGVTVDAGHVRRIARGLIRDTLSEKPENHADAFERAAGALRDKYSREPKASEIKPLIRENTGQAADPKTITEPQALRASMSKAEKAASIAYRAGEADATARGKAELADLVQKLNARTMEKEDARKELVRIVRETVPLSERGKLLTRIRDASNSDDVAAGVDMARDVIALYEGRQANSFVRSNSGKGLTNKMTQANRDAVQAARGIASAAWQKLQDASNVAERRQAADELITAQNQIKAAMHDQKIGERVLIGGQKIDAAIAREDLSNGIRATGKLRPTDELGNVKEEGKSGKALATLQDPVTLMRTVDGKADGSGVASKLWTDIRAAYTRASGRIQKARDMAHEAAIQAGYNGIGDLLEKVSGTRGEQGRKFIEVGVGGRKKLTLGEAMKLYAMDPETKEQVINGRKINWDNSRTAPAFNVTAADFAAIARALTPEQRKLVNALKTIRESFRGDLAKAHKRLKGFEPPWVEQYEPRRVNPEGTDPGKALGGSATEQLLEDAGFLKAREGGISALLVGDFLTDWTRSIDGMARFTEMAEPLRAARLVLQDPRTKGVVTKYKGEYANKLVDELFSQFGSAAGDANAINKLSTRIISNVSKAATQLNPRSWGRQFGGVLAAMSEAPPDVVASGVPMMFNRGVRERMIENSPYLAARAGVPDALRFHDLEQPGAVRGQRTIQGMARVFGDAVTSLKRGDVADAAKNASDAFNFIRASAYMDEAPAAMLWAGFEAKAQKEGKSVDWVRENVERIMQSTQNPSESIDAPLFRAAAKGTLLEPFTAFKGDSSKAYNRLKRAAEEGGFKSRTFWKAASGVLASALWSGVVTALLGNQTLKLVGGAVTGNADDEDTQKRLKNAVLMGADQTLRDVAGVVPIVGDNLYEWTLGSFIRPHGGAMQNAFDNPTSGSLSRLAIGMNGFGRGVYRTLTAEDEDTREKAGKALLKSLESAAEGAASATGIPLGPVYGMGKALVQGARGDAEK